MPVGLDEWAAPGSADVGVSTDPGPFPWGCHHCQVATGPGDVGVRNTPGTALRWDSADHQAAWVATDTSGTHSTPCEGPTYRPENQSSASA